MSTISPISHRTKPGEAFSEVADWLSEGLLVEDEQRLRFAPRGLLLANELPAGSFGSCER